MIDCLAKDRFVGNEQPTTSNIKLNIISESKSFEDHALFLKQELGRYFQQNREILVSRGMIPLYRVGIPAITKKELRIADEYNSKN